MPSRRLILDAEAVSALAHGPALRRSVVRDALVAARRNDAEVVVSAAVLAELYRGPRFNPGVDAALAREALVIADVDREVARIAGGVLTAAKAGSEDAVDAFVVATGVDGGGAVVLTGDSRDLSRLAAPYPIVSVVAV